MSTRNLYVHGKVIITSIFGFGSVKPNVLRGARKSVLHHTRESTVFLADHGIDIIGREDDNVNW